jgi:hypothetical protein
MTEDIFTRRSDQRESYGITYNLDEREREREIEISYDIKTVYCV